ncbi:MAG TPA: ParB N-terminal domain-containing protein [Planctomycetota bacterium]|nr:ParB N-terminal domain-containing protein [Planctomycetota bacterium]
MAKERAKSTRARKKKAPDPVGLRPEETAAAAPPGVQALCREIEKDGGKALVPYREPLGGHWVVLAVLPLERVEPTPHQRGLSAAHVKRLTDVIARTDRFLDPVIAVRTGDGRYLTPNGHHRASAMKAIGARSITAIVVTEPEVARLILALNVEKAHNLREKCLEAIRLARDIAAPATIKESACALEFEEAAFLTLGLAYEARPRLAGGVYHPFLKRVDKFLDERIDKALALREERVKKLLEIDDLVAALTAALKQKGFESPYLKSFVVARLNPLRFRRGGTMPFDEALDRMLAAAKGFDATKIKLSDLARSGGAPESE